MCIPPPPNPSPCHQVERMDAGDDDDDLVNSMGAMGLQGQQNGLQGYLYKRSNSVMNTANAYHKRWFVLQGYTLAWFKSNAEASAGLYPTGACMRGWLMGG